MAYSVMPTLGEPITCDRDCVHQDCNQWRETINRLCELCLKPVRSGDTYVDWQALLAGQRAIVHFACALKHAEVKP